MRGTSKDVVSVETSGAASLLLTLGKIGRIPRGHDWISYEKTSTVMNPSKGVDFILSNIDHFQNVPFTIELADWSRDGDSLALLELECWKEMAVSKGELENRIQIFPAGQWIARHMTTGEVIGILYTQRIDSYEALLTKNVTTQHEAFNANGTVLQLMSVSVLPSMAALQVGSALRSFAIVMATLPDNGSHAFNCRDVVAVTRCGDLSTSGHSFESAVASGSDSILQFHLSAGAEVVTTIDGYRPTDVSNGGNGVLISYSSLFRSCNTSTSITASTAINTDSSTDMDSVLSESFSSSDLIKLINSSCGLNLVESSTVMHTPFMELGVDSLLVVPLSRAVAPYLQYDPKVYNSVIFDFPTPAQLLESINSRSIVHIPQSSSTGLYKSENIAVTGVSCRMPGGVSTPDEFMDMLLNGKSAVVEIPKFWQDDLRTTRYAAFLDSETSETFDASFFGLSAAEAEVMDPHQRLLLEIAHEAMFDAGLWNAEKNCWRQDLRIGVYVGLCNNEWIRQSKISTLGPFTGSGVAQSSAANRLSYVFGLNGPSVVIDTACSSSLAAVHMACNALKMNDCDVALVASADLMMSSYSLAVREASGMLTSSSKNASFGSEASGYIRGEGAVAMVFRRETEVKKDSSSSQSFTEVYAVLRGSYMNQDGRSASFTAPNGLSQRRLISNALAVSEVQPYQVDYVESHGTGTPLGDPVEWGSLKDIFLTEKSSSNPLIIGAVKSNIGHLEGCAGLAGLLKTILCLKSGVVPRNLHNEVLSSAIDTSAISRPVVFPKEHMKLRNHAIAGVSSFGSGGTNVHVVVQQYLDQETQSFSSSIVSNQKVGVLFAGQGASSPKVYADMSSFSHFNKALEVCKELYPSIFSALHKCSTEECISTVESHLLLFCSEVALACHWAEKGLAPAAVSGHSFGEFAAAVSIGAITIREAIRLIILRADLIDIHCSNVACNLDDSHIERGGMVLLRASQEIVMEAVATLGLQDSFGKEFSFSSLNSSSSVAISGRRLILEKIASHIGCSARLLPVGFPFHSPLISNAASVFEKSARDIFSVSSVDDITVTFAVWKDAKIVSCLTGEVLDSAKFRSSSYWSSQMLAPVQFGSCVKSQVLQFHSSVLLEISPVPVLTALAVQIVNECTSGVNVIPSLAVSLTVYEGLKKCSASLRQLGIFKRAAGGRFAEAYHPTLVPWRLLESSKESDNYHSSTKISTTQVMDSNNIEILIRKSLVGLLGESQVSSLSNTDSFLSAGIDSLGALLIRNNLATSLNLPDLPSTIVLTTDNIVSLIKELLDFNDANCVDVDTPVCSSVSTTVVPDVSSRLEASFATTSLQQSMIFHHVSDVRLASFIETFEWKVTTGFVNVDAFYAAWCGAIRHFPGLRTEFDPFSTPVATQHVVRSSSLKCIPSVRKNTADWFEVRCVKKSLSENEWSEVISQIRLEQRQSIKDLSVAPLLRVWLVRDDSEREVVLMSIHHLIIDGASMRFLMTAVASAYNAYINVLSSDVDNSDISALITAVDETIISSSSPSFVNFSVAVDAENNLLQFATPKASASREFWLNRFYTYSAVPRVAPWKIDLSDDQVLRKSLLIEDNIRDVLLNTAQSLGVTVASIYHTLFSLFWGDFTQSSSAGVVYGATFFNRTANASVIGPMLNTVPMFADLASSNTFSNCVLHMHKGLLETLNHSSIPLATLLKLRSVDESMGNPLFSVIFDYQVSAWNCVMDDVKLNFIQLMDRIGCPLSLRVLVGDDKTTRLVVTSESSLFDEAYIHRMILGYHQLIVRVANNISKQLNSPTSSLFSVHAPPALTAEDSTIAILPSIDGKKFECISSEMVGPSMQSFETVVLPVFNIFCAELSCFTVSGKVDVSFDNSFDAMPTSIRYDRTSLVDKSATSIDYLEDLLKSNRTSSLSLPVFSITDKAHDSAPLLLQLKIRNGVVVFTLAFHSQQIPTEVQTTLRERIFGRIAIYLNNSTDVLTPAASPVPPFSDDKAFPDDTMEVSIFGALSEDDSKRLAVIQHHNDGSSTSLTYGMLRAASGALAGRLATSVGVDRLSVPHAERECSGVVAVVMEKGWEQVAAVFAVLRVGCAYLPMDAKTWPEARVRQVLGISEAVAVFTQSHLLSGEFSWLSSLPMPVLTVDDSLLDASISSESLVAESGVLQHVGVHTTSQLAYLIYTSGSTGVPKGVCCHHRGAMNTNYDLLDNFSIGQNDRVLGLSSLSFDLSVFDIFGMLCAGGALVLPPVGSVSPPDPAEWFKIVRQSRVSVWNTVPAFMDLLVSHAEMTNMNLPSSLRVIFMSGDWIPTGLLDRIRGVSGNANLQIVSMGGATEASIWSNIYEVHDALPVGWTSVPYGKPMRNQRMYILNDRLEHCEPWVTGAIFIGGVGVAYGYYRNEERTKAQFIRHPVTGEELFRTGDLGRVRPGGLLEILGREDLQVKVNGFRIELGEIEQALIDHHAVSAAVVVVCNNSLVAYIVPCDLSRIVPGPYTAAVPLDVGFVEELYADVSKSLTDYMVPSHWIGIDALPLSANGKVIRNGLPPLIVQVSSVADDTSCYSEKEKIVSEVFVSILEVPSSSVSLDTNFFSLGGDSLRSIRVVAMLKSKGLLCSITQIFQNPSVRALASVSTLLSEMGPDVLGTHSEGLSDRPVFDLHPTDERPSGEYPMIGINPAHFVGLHTSMFSDAGMSPQIYFEWLFNGNVTDEGIVAPCGRQLNISALEAAIDKFVDRHMTFQSEVTHNGTMRIVDNPPHYVISQINYWTGDAELTHKQQLAFREDMLTNGPIAFQWPLFNVRITQLSDETSIIHIVVSLFLMDAMSDLILRQELSALYRAEVFGTIANLPPIPKVSFKDYCKGMHYQLPQSPEYQRAREYWLKRIPSLPGGPELPSLPKEATTKALSVGKFTNRHRWLSVAEFRRAKANCAYHSVTLPSVLLAAYTLALYKYGSKEEFLINILLCLRHQVHEDVNKLVGNCSSTVLCHVDFRATPEEPLTLITAVLRLAKELSENLEYSVMSGIEVMQELNRQKGSTFQAVAPFIFTTPIGVEQGNRQISSRNWMFEEQFFSEKVPHTACVNAVKEDPSGTACVSMDFVDGYFPIEVIDEVFEIYSSVITLMCATDPLQWTTPVTELLNTTHPVECYLQDKAFPDDTMEVSIFGALSEDDSKRLAVIQHHNDGSSTSLTYGMLRAASGALAGRLATSVGVDRLSVPHAERECSGVVAVVMEKGWEQVAAVFAVLRVGCAYLPMDAKTWPEARVRQVLGISEAVAVFTQSHLLSGEFSWLSSLPMPVLTVDDSLLDASISSESLVAESGVLQHVGVHTTSQLAYLIYTSGSTGVPKGVCCHHRGAMNTNYDLLDNFSIGQNDRVLGLSSLSFDLSVFDIFGMLCAGGALVLPPVGSVSPPDPAEWFKIVRQSRVSVWNTVPAFMDLLVSHAEMTNMNLPSSLRVIFMSGDWIPTGLLDRIRGVSGNANLQIVSMGGATEASIWSNIYEVHDALPVGWTSVPYGKPMRNQRMYILNDRLEHCEPWVTGAIFIGGVGVAYGYYRNEERTKAQFIRHPVTGEELFRTGDLGRVRPGGLLEILGREDLQVKVNGFRIELGEIEQALVDHHAVSAAVVVVCNNSLVAYIVLEEASPDVSFETVQAGFVAATMLEPQMAASLRSHCRQCLTEYMIPAHWLEIEELPLSSNGKVARNTLPNPLLLVSSDTGTSVFVEPENETEVAVRDIFHELLKAPKSSICVVSTTFFDIGGNSLSAIQLLFALRKKFQRTLTIQQLFANSTVRGLTALLDRENTLDGEESGPPAPLRLYSLANGNPKVTPVVLFNPAGASGMCYVDLVQQLPRETPVYVIDDGAVQAGVPFEFDSIQSVARTALPLIVEQLKKIGASKFHIGGWSYGGVVAFEVSKLLSISPDLNLEILSLTVFDSPLRTSASERSKSSVPDTTLLRNTDAFMVERVLQHFAACTALLQKYHTRPLESQPLICPVIDLRPVDTTYHLPSDALYELTSGHVTFHSVEGTHWTMLSSQYSRAVAELVSTNWL